VDRGLDTPDASDADERVAEEGVVTAEDEVAREDEPLPPADAASLHCGDGRLGQVAHEPELVPVADRLGVRRRLAR
jgi:hypothetical protein